VQRGWETPFSLLKKVSNLFLMLDNSGMPRTFSELYLADAYPPMSYPSADPAVNAAVALAAGLDVADPAGARILEIGCGTGHHILSLANRWPGAECTGVDISAKGISKAKNLARQAGLANVKFCECPLQEFEPEGGFDFIIAPGFFSWVPDEVKLALMDFIGKRLSPGGIAVVSFNVVAGWRERMAVVEKVRAIQELGDTDEMTALSVMRDVAGESEAVIVDDMLAKGAEVLAFDDFAPVMDAWSLGAVVKLAEASGLKWLGDSVSGERGDDAGDDAEGRTFRAELFCGADAVLGASLPVVSATPREAKIADFPMLDAWRQVCAREALPLPDAELKPCMFSFPQLKVLAAMDGSLSVVALADHAKKVAPELDFIPWLRHVAERGLLV
jgi:trans-aconitate methyltransferase